MLADGIWCLRVPRRRNRISGLSSFRNLIATVLQIITPQNPFSTVSVKGGHAIDALGMSLVPQIAAEVVAPRDLQPCARSCREQMQMQQEPGLLDHLVGACEQRWWDGKAECLCGFEIDNEVEFGRLLDRNVARPSSA
jgi:hypothetical protein